jgi:hypothetical protein
MNKSGTLIVSALLTFGLAGASMAADMPKSAAPTAADSATPSTATKAHKHKAKKKKSTPAPATTN